MCTAKANNSAFKLPPIKYYLHRKASGSKTVRILQVQLNADPLATHFTVSGTSYMRSDTFEESNAFSKVTCQPPKHVYDGRERTDGQNSSCETCKEKVIRRASGCSFLQPYSVNQRSVKSVSRLEGFLMFTGSSLQVILSKPCLILSWSHWCHRSLSGG